MTSANTITRPQRALLIRNAAAYDFGGAERFVVSLAEQLERNGWDATVLTAHAKIRKLAHEQGVKVRRGWWWSAQNWSGARILLTPAYFAWQIVLTVWYLQLLLRLRPDVVHAQSKDDFLAATFAARLLGKRVVWTDHADLKYVYRNVTIPFKNPIGKLVRFASRFAAAITLVSDSERRLVQSALGRPLPARYRTVYNGIVDHKQAPHKRKPEDARAIVFCATSRMVAAKGISELIQAFSAISGKSSAYRLWLVGSGPEAERFKKEAAGNPDITFFGHTNKPLEYLAASDIFIHPSHHEGFSLSIIEAAMLGKPVIACDVGGNPEIITNGANGLLVPAMDADALAKAMEQLANSAPLRQKYGIAARRTYEQHFRFDTIVRAQLIPLYEQNAKN